MTRLICMRYFFHDKDPDVCGKCQEKCVQVEKEKSAKFSEIVLDTERAKK